MGLFRPGRCCRPVHLGTGCHRTGRVTPRVAPVEVKATADYCPEVVAHRGGEGDPTDANENSMGAFIRGANIGVDVMETDVWFTKDLVPVIMHDETLDRTTDATGKVSDYTWAYLKKNVRLNNGERIPSLRESLEYFAFRDLASFIEYKDAEDTCEAVQDLPEPHQEVRQERVGCRVLPGPAQLGPHSGQEVGPDVVRASQRVHPHSDDPRGCPHRARNRGSSTSSLTRARLLISPQPG